MTFRFILTIFAICFAVGCSNKEVLVVESTPVKEVEIPALPGVDSVFTAMAIAYQSRGMLVDPRTSESTRKAVEGGRRLLQIADSLISEFETPFDSIEVSDEQRALSIEQFNQGAEALQHPQMGLKELHEAAELFLSALDLNPYDEEALYWLSRVYEIQAQHFMDAGSFSDLVQSVTRLVELYPLRHDYASLLASAYESIETDSSWSDAGAWWHRASILLRDEPALSLTEIEVDTSTVFIYLANASRAFSEANQGALALSAIEEATPFSITNEEQEYVESEREWLTWDTQLVNRKRFDHLINLSSNTPDSAAIGLRNLIEQVTTPNAMVDVRHQLSLALFNAGHSADGIQEIQQAWLDVQLMEESMVHRIREDYGTMAYTMALEFRSNGELRNAIAYLLQSEATGYSGAPLSSLTRSILLRTDPEASLEAAEMAERGWDQLDSVSKRTLLEHLVSIHRRLNNRDQAAAYAQRYREFSDG